MAKLANRAKMTISSTGTGNITLASAVAGYQSFLDAGVSDGDVCRYIIEDNNGADWEIGTAAVSNNSTVLVRTVEESSAANNAALNLTSSAKVFIGVTAKDLDNAAPIFTTTPPSALNLQNDGSTAVTLNAKAYDESGIPVQYSWDAWASGGTTIYDASALPPQLASAPSINQSTGVFSLVGSSNSANAGSVNFRVKASDGVKVATHVASLALDFIPQASNLYANWSMQDTSSYSGSGTTWSDISGNSNDLTWQAATSTGAGYQSSGNLGEAVWATGSDGSYLSFATNELSTVKTVMLIMDPVGWASPPSEVMWYFGGAQNFAWYFDSYTSQSVKNVPAHAGLSANMYVNGNLTSTPAAARAGIETGKFNSLVLRGYNISAASRLFDYASTSGYNNNLEVKALLMWTVSLTDAELETAHDSFTQMATWDG